MSRNSRPSRTRGGSSSRSDRSGQQSGRARSGPKPKTNPVLAVLAAVVGAVVAAAGWLWRQLKRFGRWLADVAWPVVYQVNAPLFRSRGGRARLLELLVVPAAFAYFEVVMRLFGSTGLFNGLGFALLFALGYGFVVNFVASFLTRRAYWLVMTLALGLAGALYAFESIILASFTTYMTFATVFAAGGDAVGGFGDMVLAAIVGGIPRIVAFMWPCVAYAVVTRRARLRRPLGTPLSIEMLVLAVVFCLGGTGTSVALAEAKYASQYDFDTATKTFGLLTSLRLDVKYALFGNSAADSFTTTSTVDASGSTSDDEAGEASYGTNEMDLDLETLAAFTTDEDVLSLIEYVETLEASEQNEYTGIFEGKNLILICAEAFSGYIVSEELTPTLYRLIHNGFYFSDYYQPAWGGSTSTGEYSFLMGLVPTNGAQTIIDTASNNNYFTMGNQLQRLGYFSLAFHNGLYSYYSRQLTHYSLGYDIWLGYGNGLEDLTSSYASDWSTILAMFWTFYDQEPFSVYWMTYSGHSSYVEDSIYVTRYYDEVVSVVGEGTYSDTVIYYMCYQMSLENALTSLVEYLEEQGLADDTVIVLTTDHYPYGLVESTTYDNDVDYLAEFYSDSYDFSIPWERDSNALIIWSECLEEGGEYEDLACEVSTPTYSLDILPTLSNLFGLEYDSRLLVGRDVFSDEEAIVLWSNRSWVTERGSYDASTGEYTWNDGYEYDEEYVTRINSIVSNKMTYSSLVVETDFWGLLFGEDTVGNDGSDGNLVTLTANEPDDDDEDDDESSLEDDSETSSDDDSE